MISPEILLLSSAKGADARHHERRNTPQLFRWPLDTATVLRVFLKSAKGADARHHERRNTPQLFRSPLDTATVLRVFLKSAKGADARHHERRNTPQLFRSPLDTATVLRVFLTSILFAANLAAHAEPSKVVTLNAQDRTVLMGAFAESTGALKIADVGLGKVGWIENWKTESQSLTWTIAVPFPAEYRLSALAEGPAEGAEITIEVAGRATTVSFGRDWDRIAAGVFSLPAGQQTIIVRSPSHPTIAKFFSLEFVRPPIAARLSSEAATLAAGTAWLIADRYGLMFHWTSQTKPRHGIAKSYQQAVQDFDVEQFANSVQLTGARHVVFTTSHAEFYFPAPNEIIDSILPGRTCKRDLVGELADALAARGIKLLLYYHPGHDDLAWWTRTHFAENDKAAFFNQWCSIVSSIGRRYGKRVAGFWFDDAIFTYYPFNPPWQAMTKAAKTGNPERLVIYNSWILPRVSEFYEVFAGEASFSRDVINGYGYLPIGASGKFVAGPQKGLQGHITTVLEADWGHFQTDTPIGPLRFSPETMLAKIRDCIARKNVPSFDLEIYQDGSVAPEAVEMFKTVRAALVPRN